MNWRSISKAFLRQNLKSSLRSRYMGSNGYGLLRSLGAAVGDHCGFSTATATAMEAKMFDKILIANRGEIACRIIKSARRMGVNTVAVYSEADANSQHVLQADEAYSIGPAPAKESYLVGEKIVKVAKSSGAQGIHPGYGFLSENAGFAGLCEENGITFIGPPQSAIKSMGSKSESKIIMEQADVPFTPGYHGEDQSIERLVEEAKKVGFPIMLKAVMGGGGKGMRVVEREEDLVANIEACQREARASFGDGRILLERFLRRPRHVELQILADMHGNCVHLFERDCSVQRRHQKVLEEAPGPFMPEELRRRMGQAAVQAALAVGYVGAGTVEFMLDASDNATADSEFYFMEMNTRLQVEHPVTEMITGIDLVDWQLRVASGQVLPFTQSDIKINGHALEARVYAENPGAGFLPGTGKLEFVRTPAPSPSVRIDSGIIQGDEVTVYYDPMISKLIVHGEDRDAACKLMRKALAEYHIVGLPTNIEFLRACVTHPAFVRGGVDTSFIAKHEQDLLGRPPSALSDARVAAMAIVANALLASKPRERHYSHIPFGFRVNGKVTELVKLELYTDDGSEPRIITVEASLVDARKDGSISMTVSVEDGNVVNLVGKIIDDDQGSREKFWFDVDGVITKITAVQSKNKELVIFNNNGGEGIMERLAYQVKPVLPDWESQGGDADKGLTAPMPGKIIKVMVEPNQAVKKGQALIIMEAMKMEHVIKASSDGIVEVVHVNVDDVVDDTKILCKIISN